jgi:cell division protein FtsI/penicillin-binding protein 2
VGTWSADPDVPCRGCQLSLAVAGDLDGENRLTFAAAGDCASLEVPGVALGEADWRSAQALRWRDLSLRHVVRNEPPWLAVTDPATGRRYFAGEFYQRGGLEPLLGDASGLSGVEAALSRYLEDGAEISAPPAMELSIDGDLQLAATAIVRHRAKNVLDERPEEPESVPVTAVILDAMTGEVLAAVNASASASSRSHRGEELVPTAWSLGSGQVQRGENAAFLRRRALGSTMKIAGAYALVNNGLEPGSEIARRQPGIAFQESSASGDGAIFIDDVSRRRELEEGRRLCSTGPHLLPAGDAGFTEGTFVRRFAQSCNNFFVLTGFRHAGSRPARFSEWRRSQSPEALPDELVVDVRRPTEATLFQPAFGLQPLVDRIRDGLADDFAAGEPRIPMSYFGILFRLGFQPRPKLFEAGGTVAAELTFEHDGQEVRVPLAHGWFASPDAAVPALRPGRDFSYPAVPSPGRLDEATRSRPVTETYDDKMEAVGRLDDDGKWADVQYAMLQIGQSNIEISALGLASLYAPAARSDGRAVRPCLFRAGCGEERRGEQVLDVDRAAVLNRALRAVISSGGTAWARSREPVLAPLREGGWGGKTGTYQVARRNWPRGFSQADWWRLRAWACGVEGAGRPALPAELDKLRNPKIAGLVAELTSADRGSALGARACEDPSWPLNPAGVQGYNPGGLPESLDRFAEGLRRARGDGIPTVYHSFVAVALPPREGEAEAADPAAGLVVAVMVDRETPGDQKIAVEIGAELALAAGRWATLAR